MALPAPSAGIGDWSATISEVVKSEGFYNGYIQIVDPNSGSATPYDVDTDTGGTTTPILIREGAARITKVRRPKQINGTAKSVTASGYRFQMELDPLAPFISEGMIVVVTDGGKEPQLTQLTYVVLASLNESWAALTTIETIAELTPVNPPDLSGLPQAVISDSISEAVDAYMEANPVAASGGFVHMQTTAVAQWAFANPLGRLPNVEIYVSDGNGGYDVVDTDVDATTTQVTITFPEPTAGYAVLT